MCDGSSGNGSGPAGLTRENPGYDPEKDTLDFLLDEGTAQQSTVERQNRARGRRR